MDSPSPLGQRPLGDLVSENPRAAAIFDGFGFDYCCHGHQTLAEAAETKGVALASVVEALAGLGQPSTDDRAVLDQDLDALTRYIVDRHHAYVRERSPQITAWLDKLVARHGDRHAELAEVRQVFVELRDELLAHMMKEENILFPFINDLAAAKRTGAHLPQGPFGTIMHPVRVMESDHQLAGELMSRVHTLTNGYTLPADACTTYRLCYTELAAYEQDLHRHIHLENNVLFPRALEVEATLA